MIGPAKAAGPIGGMGVKVWLVFEIQPMKETDDALFAAPTGASVNVAP